MTQMRNEELTTNCHITEVFSTLTFQEIADLYHLPVSTIQSRHTQALIKLRNFMKECDSFEKT